MEMADLITRDAILPAVKAGGIKQFFQKLGVRAGDAYGLDPRFVVDGLLAREKQGSTGIGAGVAIPHARLAGLTSISGLFARLEVPVDFEAADRQWVDLVFVILTPKIFGADHLLALARVSRLLSNSDLRNKLRDTSEAEALYALITEPAAYQAA